eukprot:TRINITY_DN23132_c0_g1_i1.p1 TRINITY_DN23132_c0_g1~~TRINITY_DN23132_c0_g1_i1.p1  ORF type:complete len:172 (-),score=36.35 TRINITY_DN23132_c0_g1_i1:519-1034(-)
MAAARGQMDLLDCIEWHSVECLNEDPNHSFANALKQGYRDDRTLSLASDGDEQLLLHIPFNQVVKLHTLIVKGPPEEGPKVVKLYANRTSMGFSNTADFPPSDTLTLTPAQLKGTPVPLKYVKFQNVRSLTIFIESNQGEEESTVVEKIAIIGSTVETTNMSELKKVDHKE